MRKYLFSFCLLCLNFIGDAQLLSCAPQFPVRTLPVNITMDATRGNNGIPGCTGTKIQYSNGQDPLSLQRRRILQR